MSESAIVHVVAAAVFDRQGRVLIARRPEHVHQGGLWEFPGGKVETGETVYDALRRELHEEVAIETLDARPLIRIHHNYPDKSVLLDVWRVNNFSGHAHGREGQPMQWVRPEDLANYQFPLANQPIVSAIRLPERYLITPEPGPDEQGFLSSLSIAVNSGISLLQLRAKSLSAESYLGLAHKVQRLCKQQGCRLVLNADPELVEQVGAAGVHLSGQRLMGFSTRPIGKNYWLGASCHSLEEIEHAAAIDVDFAVLGPVENTPSHPDSRILGWEGFSSLVEQASFPVYALGGMGWQHLDQAFTNGAQGIAAISSFWPSGEYQ